MGRAPQAKSTTDPDVMLDVVLVDGFLWLDLTNRRDRPARDVTVTFRGKVPAPFSGIDLAGLPLWKGLTFLAPLKTVRVPLDRPDSYLARTRSSLIDATVRYTDADGTIWVATMRHDIAAYRGLPSIVARAGGADR